MTSFTTNYKNFCIYREFLSPDILLIMVYSSENEKFYQKTITTNEFLELQERPIFMLDELEKIIKAAIAGNSKYSMGIKHSDENQDLIEIYFDCVDEVRNSKWQITLVDKIKDDTAEISKIVSQYTEECKKEIVNIIDKDEILKIFEAKLNMLHNRLCAHSSNLKKETSLIPYISKMKTDKETTVITKTFQRTTKTITIENEESEEESGEGLDEEIDTEESIEEINGKDEENEESELSEEEVVISKPEKKGKIGNVYSEFMKKELEKLRRNKPGFTREKYENLAQKKWEKKRDKNRDKNGDKKFKKY